MSKEPVMSVAVQSAYIDTMAEAKPRSIAIYRRGPAWIRGRELRNQPTLLDHGRFLAKLELSGLLICDILAWHVADA
jgi:hypothetical protein